MLLNKLFFNFQVLLQKKDGLIKVQKEKGCFAILKTQKGLLVKIKKKKRKRRHFTIDFLNNHVCIQVKSIIGP